MSGIFPSIINSIVSLAGSSVTMWWKRRPRGGIGVPPHGGRSEPFVLGAIGLVGLLFPLTGLSFAAAVLLDITLARLRILAR